MSQPPTPDSSWKGLPSWLFFAFLAIGPPAALVTFTRTLTQNPVLIALLVLGYETLLFVLRFTGKIWQQLEETLVKYTAQWLSVRTQEVTSRYYQRYCQYLVYEHQVFDVKGLSTRMAHDLELEQVFVDLRIHPMPSHLASADLLHLPEFLQGTHSISDYLSTATLANSHLVVLGVPGSGKTTLLKHLALILAQPKKYPRRRGVRHTFPILLFLRDHARAIVDQPDFSLAKAVQDHIQQTWQQTMPVAWIGRYLEKGKCLVLLDGLDEVADSSTRQLVVAWVQRQLIAYGSNRFVLTSRPYGYRDNPLDGVTVLDVQAFTSDQVEQFVQNWYLANEIKSWGKDDPGVRMRAREGTRDLLQRLNQAPALLALAVNPLLLTMIATVHRYRSSLPGKRVELYAEICEVFLGKRYEARGIAQDLSPAQKQQVLQPLAYFLMQHETRVIDREGAREVIAPALALVSPQMQPTEYLQLIENTSGLLLERNPGIYSFAHLTFQEYLAAVYIKEEGLEQVLVAQVANSWLHETIRLYCAQADATALILACLAGNPPTAAALTLAFECDKEKLKIQPRAQDQLNAVLEAGGEDSDPERRRVIVEALLAQRVRRMVHLRQETYIDISLITCAEYQMFLDEQRAQGRYYQPDHWTSVSFPAGSGKTPVLGVRRSDAQAFCDWLTTRDMEGRHYRLPRVEERPPQEESGWRELSTETGYWVEDEPFFVWSKGKPSDILQQQLSNCIARAFDRARDHANVLANVLDRALARARGRTLVLDRALDRSRPDALTFARDLAHDRDRAIDCALDRSRPDAHDRDRDLDRAIDCALDFARDLAHDRDRDLAQSRASARFLAHARFLARARAHNRDLAHNRFLAHDHAHNRAQSQYSSGYRIKPHSRARILNLARNRASERASACDLYFDLYVTLFLLQERNARNLPTYEGILLVQENPQVNRPAT